MRSAWICTRNDVLGNLAVLLAAVGVFGTGTMTRRLGGNTKPARKLPFNLAGGRINSGNEKSD